ncbi:hypothetical protein [Streptomyces sp. H27-C3]|uniref:hypothetical protein n=1 Tax=Streptomyces sp. H27-C3 TaxID=3046305 RepID=UPI0024BBDE08|nr:hypothetical protein [Streptomyces sp. H27-C3]MDJ0464958.1 hypothetical protein [Streptomyces sp. H27-C3]
MPTPPRSARRAVELFVATFRSVQTRGQRRTYMEEFLLFLAGALASNERELLTSDLLDEEAVLVWLTAAQRGATRRRTGMQGPHTAASVSAMAARTTTINKFSAHYRRPLNLPVPQATLADRLSPSEAVRTLRLLSGHPPAKMFSATWQRTVAVLALAVATRRGIGDLHPLRLEDLELKRRLPRVRIGEDEYFPLDTLTTTILKRWLDTHAALTAQEKDGASHGLQGGQVQELWVTTAPGRPRAGQPARRPGLPAARRTLESAHRTLMMEALGSPLLLEQFCSVDPDE